MIEIFKEGNPNKLKDKKNKIECDNCNCGFYYKENAIKLKSNVVIEDKNRYSYPATKIVICPWCKENVIVYQYNELEQIEFTINKKQSGNSAIIEFKFNKECTPLFNFTGRNGCPLSYPCIYQEDSLSFKVEIGYVDIEDISWSITYIY